MKYNIICHDGKTFEITIEQKEKILELSCGNTKGIDVSGVYIAFSNIARIEKSNTPSYPQLPTINETIEKFSKPRRVKALKSMARGLNKYITSPENKGTGKPEKLYKKMLLRIEQARK